ncbi:EthD domain-containing protein [Chloroflexota bacterium]
MIKRMTLLKRKPGLSREELRKQYEEVHVPLLLNLLPTIRKLVRNYIAPTNVIPTSTEEPEFDCITEIWFDDMEGYQAMMDAMAGDAGQAIRHSAQVFVDGATSVNFLVEEVESDHQ